MTQPAAPATQITPPPDAVNGENAWYGYHPGMQAMLYDMFSTPANGRPVIVAPKLILISPGGKWFQILVTDQGNLSTYELDPDSVGP